MSGLAELYRDLHQHPELSFQETRTAAIAAGRLRAAGFDTAEGVGGTGVVGVLRERTWTPCRCSRTPGWST